MTPLNVYPQSPDNDAARSSSKSLSDMLDAIKKPWYKKTESWFSLVAAIAGIIQLFFLIN